MSMLPCLCLKLQNYIVSILGNYIYFFEHQSLTFQLFYIQYTHSVGANSNGTVKGKRQVRVVYNPVFFFSLRFTECDQKCCKSSAMRSGNIRIKESMSSREDQNIDANQDPDILFANTLKHCGNIISS